MLLSEHECNFVHANDRALCLLRVHRAVAAIATSDSKGHWGVVAK